ncbi:MAG: hypothetical protein SFY80_16195 [Verrucomicrobiota bacterium]|nr:hypothetical protein [Verrucomicrobiota bacterium]
MPISTIPPSIFTQFERSLIRVVETGKHVPADVLLDEIKHLDKLIVTHKNAVPPKFRHFIENRSYAKAMHFLRGEPPAEACAPQNPETK